MSAYNSKLKKAVIPVSFLGTLMLPATISIPKDLLQMVDKTLIKYVFNYCISAG
ncbi:UTP--glucose-1-phosphate uridylyltransferase, partial [Erwinia amylovora]|nr:UTP--glucose-1-phosphate uridylyltransferase [Erwinia amylovora]